MTSLLHALANLARLRWLGAAFCALAMLCVTTHASALAGATAHPRVDDNTTINASADNTTTASASEVAQPKDRVWGFDQNSPLHVWSLRVASAETHRGISPNQRETASGPSYLAEGAVVAAEGVTTTALTAGDLGLSGSGLAEVTGSVVNAGSTRVITVDMIKAIQPGTLPLSEIRGALPRILSAARAQGVTTLQIQASFANAGLQDFVAAQVAKFGAFYSSTGGVETLTFILGIP